MSLALLNVVFQPLCFRHCLLGHVLARSCALSCTLRMFVYHAVQKLRVCDQAQINLQTTLKTTANNRDDTSFIKLI